MTTGYICSDEIARRSLVDGPEPESELKLAWGVRGQGGKWTV